MERYAGDEEGQDEDPVVSQPGVDVGKGQDEGRQLQESGQSEDSRLVGTQNVDHCEGGTNNEQLRARRSMSRGEGDVLRNK